MTFFIAYIWRSRLHHLKGSRELTIPKRPRSQNCQVVNVDFSQISKGNDGILKKGDDRLVMLMARSLRYQRDVTYHDSLIFRCFCFQFTLRIPTPLMETPGPVDLTPHDIPRILRVVNICQNDISTLNRLRLGFGEQPQRVPRRSGDHWSRNWKKTKSFRTLSLKPTSLRADTEKQGCRFVPLKNIFGNYPPQMVPSWI